MNFVLTPWPGVDRLIWTAATIAAVLLFGYIVNHVVVRQLQRLAKHTDSDWDDAIILEFKKRVPFWSVLAGLWLSLGYWQLPQRACETATQPCLSWNAIASEAIGALAILSVTAMLAAIAIRLITVLAPRVSPDMHVSGLMRGVVRMVIFTIGLLVVLRGLNVEITPMLAALGVGGLAVALALQEPLSNLFAGLFITVAGQVHIGDYIKIEPGPEGVVADFKWNATQLQTLSGNIVIVPNAKFIQSMVTNYHRPSADSGFSVEFTVSPATKLADLERIAVGVGQDVMRDVAGGVPGAEAQFRCLAFSDLGVRCALSVRSRQFTDQAFVRHELIKRLHAALTANGVEIATLKLRT